MDKLKVVPAADGTISIVAPSARARLRIFARPRPSRLPVHRRPSSATVMKTDLFVAPVRTVIAVAPACLMILVKASCSMRRICRAFCGGGELSFGTSHTCQCRGISLASLVGRLVDNESYPVKLGDRYRSAPHGIHCQPQTIKAFSQFACDFLSRYIAVLHQLDGGDQLRTKPVMDVAHDALTRNRSHPPSDFTPIHPKPIP